MPALDDAALAALREAAERATQGPWREGDGSFVVSDHPVSGGLLGSDDVEHYGGHLIAESVALQNRPFIARANPPTILAVLDRLDAAERENETLRIAMMGGEDAPGHARSIPLDELVEAHDRHLREQSYWREAEAARAHHAEVARDLARGEAETLREALAEAVRGRDAAEARAARLEAAIEHFEAVSLFIKGSGWVACSDAFSDLFAALAAERDEGGEAMIEFPKLPPEQEDYLAALQAADTKPDPDVVVGGPRPEREAAEARAERLAAALLFYADRSQYEQRTETTFESMDLPVRFWPVLRDGGAKARAALAAERGEAQGGGDDA